MTPIEITLKFANPSDSVPTQQILYTLFQAEKHLTKIKQRNLKDFQKGHLANEHTSQYLRHFKGQAHKQIAEILKTRQEFNEGLVLNSGSGTVEMRRSWLPDRTDRFYRRLFYVVFWVIYLTNIFIINSKLNVWYFVMSTSMISVKLFFTFMPTTNKDPGYLTKSRELCFTHDILK
mmetsp:Transcript_18384/g.31423  ORF Transcript_18384/g.31423 Transcript_18384/m.31423 type:complete len:176 (+) Transcript_18384:950-1477(+)